MSVSRVLLVLAAVAMVLASVQAAQATVYVFRFSEEDLWNHTPSGDSALYDQDAPRRHHTAWKSNVQTTDSAQPNQSQYNRQLGMGTNGFYQTATYDAWLSGGPLDNDGQPFGIAGFNMWGANFPNSKFAWGERFKIADTGAAAWQILQTPAGWTGQITQNPWPDAGFVNPMYFPEWYADSYADRILYSAFGNGVDDYVFEFAVDIVGEYPSSLEGTPDGNPFEADGSLRIWFGGYAMNEAGEFTNEGFDGIMELAPVPEPATLLVWGLLGVIAGGCGWLRRKRAA